MLNQSITKGSYGAQFRADGAAFLGLSLLCGLAGGFLGAVSHNAGPFHALSHGLLLDLFVLIPAFLGGMGRLVLPGELTTLPGLMVRFDRLAFLLLFVGALSAVYGAREPAAFVFSLALWGFGTTFLALSTIVKCLECRVVRFRDLSPFAWSQLLASLGLIVMAPVFMAGLLHDLVAGHAWFASVQFWLGKLQVPVLALVVQLALGAIANLVAFHSTRLKITLPLLMAIPSLLVPVVWAHGVTVPRLSDDWLLGMGVAAPSFGIMALICASLWGRSFALTAALSWSFPALLLLSAGWVLSLFPVRPEAFHSAMLFGAVFALFGCYYRWQEQIPSIAAPHWLCRVHLVAMGVSALAMMPLLPVLQRCGEIGMIVSLFCVAVLGARALLPRQPHSEPSAVEADFS
ncbi:hypothetical protein HW511_03985 [Asaia siamensis]|uniref:Cytochrome c oxidase subunit 1 n=1 Tax=Asaia siamensis TaxID=110479 RepID=A0ABQ1LFP8_9PROT|nr:hypothetical protein [Asaia siamensis]GBR08449.1 cytochrome c oxidase subunit I [Asaia siamensis NRIC 0323]GGC22775.1 hypothetical protein GCM10007207_05000 [Asaia siamensis]